jgi:hypothetical protein
MSNQTTEGNRGMDAAGDGDFCKAIAAYICQYRHMEPEHREVVLKMLEIEAARRKFTDLREFICEQAAVREGHGLAGFRRN